MEGLMTDKRDLPIEEEEYERNLNYNPPAQKTLEEIQEMDKDDESLLRYKQALLGTLPVTAGVYVIQTAFTHRYCTPCIH